MDLPSKENVFHFECLGATFGKKYEGRFTVLCALTIGQKHGLALEKTRLLGNYPNPTDDLAGFAVILANLRAKVIDGPDWWKQSDGGSTLDEENVLIELYNKVQEAELEWKKKLQEKAEKQQSSPPSSTP